MQGLKPGHHILVPFDFSKYSEKAMVFAARLAEGLSMELLILHVVHDRANDPRDYHHRDGKKLVRPKNRSWTQNLRREISAQGGVSPRRYCWPDSWPN